MAGQRRRRGRGRRSGPRGRGQMTGTRSPGARPAGSPIRPDAVAGMFYPAVPDELRDLVDRLVTAAARLPDVRADTAASRGLPAGILVPHAGLAYSGIVAAAGWSRLRSGHDSTGHAGGAGGTVNPAGSADLPLTVVLLGTNHRASWLGGVAAWDAGAWATPVGEVAVDAQIAAAILNLGPPFVADRRAHGGEHSIEVQLPLLRSVDPLARVVPLAVSAGNGARAITAGAQLGALLAERRAAGARIVLVISTDMAYYPPAGACERATGVLLPPILALDPVGLAQREDGLRDAGIPGLACGMCGIDPAVLGLAALQAMGATRGTILAAATSADAGGPPDRTVGYLAARFDT
jgi:AmmeMemoRadiSam system protein B